MWLEVWGGDQELKHPVTGYTKNVKIYNMTSISLSKLSYFYHSLNKSGLLQIKINNSAKSLNSSAYVQKPCQVGKWKHHFLIDLDLKISLQETETYCIFLPITHLVSTVVSYSFIEVM